MTALLSQHARTPVYLLLNDALARGVVEITENSPTGQVSVARIINHADQPVLLLDGAELAGARQNRMVNLTMLVEPGQALEIPVTCMERGRWRTEREYFKSRSRTAYASLRKSMTAQVSAALTHRGQPFTDQHAVWSEIDSARLALAPALDSTAMTALYDTHTDALERFAPLAVTSTGQVGVELAEGDEIHGVEIFDCAAATADSLPSITQSYGLDSLRSGRSIAGWVRRRLARSKRG